MYWMLDLIATVVNRKSDFLDLLKTGLVLPQEIRNGQAIEMVGTPTPINKPSTIRHRA